MSIHRTVTKLSAVEQLRQHVRDAVANQVRMARFYHREAMREKRSSDPHPCLNDSFRRYRLERQVWVSAARITRRALNAGECFPSEDRRTAAHAARWDRERADREARQNAGGAQ